MSQRIQRINELIKREISAIILREVEFPPDVLVTVTRAETSVDLKNVKVWISAMPEEKSKKVLRILNEQIYDLQQRINKKLKMRPVPRIVFREERQVARAARIEEILEEIKNQEVEKRREMR